MAGLLDTTALKPIPPAGQMAEVKPFSYDANLGTVNLDTDSVSGQLDKILSQDSPYITRARAGAAQTANNRGLLNSSIGAGAGEAAAIDAALPIAAQDANTFSTQRLTNQQASNTAGQYNATAENQAGIVNAGAANDITKLNIAGQQQLGAIAASGEQARLTGAQSGAQALEQIKAQGQQNIGSIGAQGEQSRLTAAQNADAQQKLQAQQGEIQKQLQTADATTRASLLAQQGQLDTQMQNLRGQQSVDLLRQKGELDKQMQTADAATRANLLAQQGQIDTAMQNLRSQQISDLTRQQAGDSTELQALKGTQAQALADTEAAYKAILQTSASASQLFSNMLAQMSGVLNNTETSADAKTAALQAQRDVLASGLAIIGSIGDVDLSSLIDFG